MIQEQHHLDNFRHQWKHIPDDRNGELTALVLKYMNIARKRKYEVLLHDATVALAALNNQPRDE